MSEPRFERIHVSLLHVDPIVQRATDPNRAAAMAKKFDPNAAGALIVSHRDDGKYFILDGGHRHAAAIVAKYDGKLNCVVHEGLTIGEEAALFLALNDSKLVQAIDKFRMRVIANEPDAIVINDMLESYGWQVKNSAGTGNFGAVAAIEKVYNGAGVTPGGKRLDVVEDVIRHITDAWDRHYTSGHSAIVGGLGQLLMRFGAGIDSAKLVTEMSKRRPVDLVAKAKSLKDSQGGTVPAAMAKVLVGLHNHQRRTNRLPDWTWTR